MKLKENKYPDNIQGEFYVDDNCIDCDLCRTTAPNHFKRNDFEGYSFIYNQPTTEDEVEECEEALDLCPTKAISNDGS